MTTAKTIKALKIIKKHEPIRPREFSELMWPDSEGHERHSRCGASGSTAGGGMWLAAGGYLGRLAKRGFPRSSNPWVWVIEFSWEGE